MCPLVKGPSFLFTAKKEKKKKKLVETFLFPFLHQSLDRKENSDIYFFSNANFASILEVGEVA